MFTYHSYLEFLIVSSSEDFISYMHRFKRLFVPRIQILMIMFEMMENRLLLHRFLCCWKKFKLTTLHWLSNKLYMSREIKTFKSNPRFDKITQSGRDGSNVPSYTYVIWSGQYCQNLKLWIADTLCMIMELISESTLIGLYAPLSRYF